MEPADDSVLLRAYCDNQSDDAFAELVTRHVNLVYSVALRQLGNTHEAEEITQAVFIVFAKKTRNLRHHKAVSSWLFQTTRLTVNNFLRSERRRQSREQEAHMSFHENEPDNGFWPQIAPLLDAAVANLNEQDRRAIVMRFYEGKNLHDVGTALAINEEAAKKRVSRALDKLQNYFCKRGIHSTADTIAETISVNSIQTAPALLAKTAATVAIAHGANASTSILTLTKGVLKIMAWTKMKTAAVVSTCVLLTAGTATLTIYKMGEPMRKVQSEWSVISGNEGQWSWSAGKIEAHTIDGDSILASSKKYSDFTFSANVSTPNREASLAFRMLDASNGFILNFTPVNSPGEPNGFVRIRKRVGNDETTIAMYQGPRLAATGRSAKMKVVAKGSSIQVFLNGANVLRLHDTTFTNGYLGLRVYGWGDSPCDATFSDLSFP